MDVLGTIPRLEFELIPELRPPPILVQLGCGKEGDRGIEIEYSGSYSRINSWTKSFWTDRAPSLLHFVCRGCVVIYVPSIYYSPSPVPLTLRRK
jgi:hypothetical protein